MLTSRTPRLLVFALLAALPFAACECDTVSEIPEPDLEVHDEAGNRHTEADPWLVVAFGDVDDGGSKVHTLALHNVGRARLELTKLCLVNAASAEDAASDTAPCVQLGDTAFSFPNVIGQPVSPNDKLELPITFSPRQGGPTSYFLRIESNDPEEPVVAVELTGRGTAGQLCADNAILDFGEVYVGDTKTMQVTLENCGLRPVTIDSYVLTSPDDVFSVALDGAAPAAPIGPLEPGDSITLDVTFAPTQTRSYRDTLAGQATLTTAAPFLAAYTLLFVGDARTPPACRVNVVPPTVQFGAVASNATATQQLVIQSVGECACEVSSLEGPVPGDVGFTIPTPPSLPVVLRGTRGCDGDPEGAQDQSNLLIVDVAYTAPERNTPTVDNATLTVTTSDPNNPVREVSLEANGGGTPFCQMQVTPRGGGPLGGLIPAQGRYGVVEFGRVTIHFEKRMPIELKNIGNTVCTIEGVEWDVAPNTTANEFGLEYEDGTPVNVGNAPPISLQPGQTQRFMAVFKPTHTVQSSGIFPTFGNYSAANPGGLLCGNALTGPTTRCNGVKFLTNDTATPNDQGVENGDFSIGFSATPVEPAIDVIPGEVDFGLVTLDCGSPLRRVNVYNTGSGDLIVGQPYATPETTPPTFEVAANAPSFPHTIPPGGMMAIDVRFYARNLGVVTGDLIIPTFEGGQEGPPVGVPLRGEGTLETHQTDIFDQFNDPKVDVLWVVDDSGSMQPFQTALAQNFPTFFTASDVNQADFHIAVTTTLALDPGCIDLSGMNNCADDPMSGHYTACSGNDRYLTPASNNPEAQFNCNVQVSNSSNVRPSRSSSDNAEAGLQAARNFLQPPHSDDPSANAGFLRDDAKLHVIIVSDEPDQSKGPIDLYIDFFRNLKGFRNDSLVAVSAVAAPAGGCSGTDQNGNSFSASGDARYPTVVQELNGRFQSICDTNWNTMMSNLGLASLGLKVEFFLSRAADAATLSVCVRSGSPTATCTPVSQTSEGAANGYFYDPSSNSIVFNPGSVPPRGSRVEVNYETYCY